MHIGASSPDRSAITGYTRIRERAVGRSDGNTLSHSHRYRERHGLTQANTGRHIPLANRAAYYDHLTQLNCPVSYSDINCRYGHSQPAAVTPGDHIDHQRPSAARDEGATEEPDHPGL